MSIFSSLSTEHAILNMFVIQICLLTPHSPFTLCLHTPKMTSFHIFPISYFFSALPIFFNKFLFLPSLLECIWVCLSVCMSVWVRNLKMFLSYAPGQNGTWISTPWCRTCVMMKKFEITSKLHHNERGPAISDCLVSIVLLFCLLIPILYVASHHFAANLNFSLCHIYCFVSQMCISPHCQLSMIFCTRLLLGTTMEISFTTFCVILGFFDSMYMWYLLLLYIYMYVLTMFLLYVLYDSAK